MLFFRHLQKGAVKDSGDLGAAHFKESRIAEGHLHLIAGTYIYSLLRRKHAAARGSRPCPILPQVMTLIKTVYRQNTPRGPTFQAQLISETASTFCVTVFAF